jgi:hypothetical protein
MRALRLGGLGSVVNVLWVAHVFSFFRFEGI